MSAGNHSFKAGSSPSPCPPEGDTEGFFEAARTGDLDYLRDFLALYGDSHVDIRDNYKSTALTEAAAHGRSDVIALLLDHGADIAAADWASGASVLMTAARQGKESCVRTLLARGADIEAKDALGQTTLVREASLGGDRMVALLLELGADIEAGKDKGQTALRAAAIYGRSDIVRSLLSRGAETVIDLPDALGRTPLMWAANTGMTGMTGALLEAGANMHLRNKEAETALDIARRNGHEGAARLIQEAKPEWRARAAEREKRRAQEGQAGALRRASALEQLRKRAAERPLLLKKQPPKGRTP